MIKCVAVSFLAIVFLSACGGTTTDRNSQSSTPSTEDSPANKPKPKPKFPILEIVNQERAKGADCGGEIMPPVGPLRWDGLLSKAAKAHADSMNEHNYFSHTGKDESQVSDRVDRTGYRWRAVGENIAMGYTTAKSVMQGWMDSPGHCKNVMAEVYTELGLARTGNYWVQVFGTPFNESDRL